MDGRTDEDHQDVIVHTDCMHDYNYNYYHYDFIMTHDSVLSRLALEKIERFSIATKLVRHFFHLELPLFVVLSFFSPGKTWTFTLRKD